jgi:hypothetical protein
MLVEKLTDLLPGDRIAIAVTGLSALVCVKTKK